MATKRNFRGQNFEDGISKVWLCNRQLKKIKSKLFVDKDKEF